MSSTPPPFIPPFTSRHYWYPPESEGTVRDLRVEDSIVVIETYEGGAYRYRFRGLSVSRMKLPGKAIRYILMLPAAGVLVILAIIAFSMFTSTISLASMFMQIFLIIFILCCLSITLHILALYLSPRKDVLVVLDDTGLRHFFEIKREDLYRIRSIIEKL
ncbi:hypothetical protein J4526_07400 [Desulfurococcaceae archaeon MEX13E-LK6-19]|nr:hypothetical protein J4526_07400 [Desulfurococcaceae archaeon MEX13E-LK6-19]